MSQLQTLLYIAWNCTEYVVEAAVLLHITLEASIPNPLAQSRTSQKLEADSNMRMLKAA
jgi:hypothetical protein